MKNQQQANSLQEFLFVKLSNDALELSQSRLCYNHDMFFIE